MKHSELIKIITKQTGKTPTQQDIAKILHIPRGTVASRSSRNLNYNFDEVMKIADYYNVNLYDDKKEHFVNLESKYAKMVEVTYRPNVYLSAGYGIEVYDEQAQTMILDKRLFITDRGSSINPNNCEVVTVSGNSMAPEYKHGDRVILDKSVTSFIDGHIFAFRYAGECFIKEINLIGKRVKAIPLNKEYEPFFIEENEDVKILGRIVPRVRL